MSAGISGATGGAAAAAAIANAIKASGVLVRLEPDEFLTIVDRWEAPLVVICPRSFFRPHRTYMVSYKGFAFYTKTKEHLPLPPDAEIVNAQTISIPM